MVLFTKAQIYDKISSSGDSMKKVVNNTKKKHNTINKKDKRNNKINNKKQIQLEQLKQIGKKILEKGIILIKKYCYIVLLFIPFLAIDIITRFLGNEINFFKLWSFVPNLFTLTWISFLISICLCLKRLKGKIVYITFFIISFILFLVNNIYYSITDSFFSFNLLGLASEGSAYFKDAIVNCNPWVYILSIIILLTFVLALKFYPKVEKTNKKNIAYIFLLFIIIHSITPIFLGKANDDLEWSTWRNPRNIYINFNDSNKSMMISGIYEYSFRDFYITYLKPKKSVGEEELSFLEDAFTEDEEQYSNSYTGKYKDKNLIIIQLEGIDTWMLTKKDTPTLYKMMNNSINFTKHYSYYNGGGSTFNSEFMVNTGFITPLSYTQNAYTFNKNKFPYSLANLFKQKGYTVNAFHMNTGEYYSRATNYKNWGYDNYFGLKDLGTYKDNSYELDRELILNETFNQNLFSDEKFVDYIIAYSSHLPFSTSSGVCKKLIIEDTLKELDLEELPKGYVLPEMTEEDCARRQAKETDYMVELLLQNLEEKELLDDTVIVVFTDHYLYTLPDQTIIQNYKKTDNNLLNQTPFFIWTNKGKSKKIKQVTSQLNVLPTLLNLFGLEYHPNYYIGDDALDSKYKGYVFFSDYSWYDGNVYVEGGEVTNNKKIDPIQLEDKNYYINYIIRKNDLTLKTDYFKKLKEKNFQ